MRRALEDYFYPNGRGRDEAGQNAPPYTCWRSYNHFIFTRNIIYSNSKPLVMFKKVHKILKSGRLPKVLKAAGIAKKKKKKDGNI